MPSGTRHSSVVSGNIPCFALESGTGDRYKKSRGDRWQAKHMHTLDWMLDLRKMSDLLWYSSGKPLFSVVRALSQQLELHHSSGWNSSESFHVVSLRVVTLEAPAVMPSELSHRLTPELR